MHEIQRRAFVKSSAAGALAVTSGLAAVTPRPAGAVQAAGAAQAADSITVGVIGPGGMGSNHLRLLAARQDVRVAYVCDVDATRLAKAAVLASQTSGREPKAVKDLRQILDDKSVDAVFIATPDHWHAPASILALEAGKHVYVEKPCCHNLREGRLMAEAVQRSGKCLQVGTQSRSTDFVREAVQRVREGEIGEVLVAKAWNSQRRGSIGKSSPSQPPEQLDFDLWLGPAPRVAYRSNLLHGVWRWWYDFGCGDIGNDGVHDIDVAVWGLGVDSHPNTVACLGGKYHFDDDQQFPDTQYAVCEYEAEGAPPGRRRQLIFEQRIWSPYTQEGYENGAAFYGTSGMLVIGHTRGWKLYGPRNQLLAERTGSVDLPGHHQNFFECIRDNQRKLNADVQAGTLSAGIVHLANISARMQRTLRFDPDAERIMGDEEADALVRRSYREGGHWAVPRGV